MLYIRSDYQIAGKSLFSSEIILKINESIREIIAYFKFFSA